MGWGRGQANAVGFPHGFDHILSQLFQLGPKAPHLLGLLPQHGAVLIEHPRPAVQEAASGSSASRQDNVAP